MMPQQSKRYRTLRLVLGDQLNSNHSWFKQVDPDVVYLIAELAQETDYVKHHVQKLCAFFAAMERFASELTEAGHNVIHLTLDKTIKYNNLEELIKVNCDMYAVTCFEFQQPDEFRLQQQLQSMKLPQSIARNEYDSEHFLLARDELTQYVTPGKHNRLETFYRKMRRRFDILMQDDQPLGGSWNFDAENRQNLRATDLESVPQPLLFDNDVTRYLDRLDRHGVAYFGTRTESLLWPISREQSLELLDFFCRYCLPNFGRFQDAMTCQSPHQWSLFHSRLSFAINSKMLNPMEVLTAAIQTYQSSDGSISIAQIEGFVRQIIGWREYVRAVYWGNMPQYADLNQLEAERTLPAFFWHGETRMNCMRHALGQSLDYAYAHHIQRLMIIGNFCLLAGIDPEQVDAWYLGVYIDAIEWVEMPNTRGMSQFADGGLIATKPYSAGGNYINKMSDYCKSCHYDVKQKTGDNACPFNSLYWNFMDQHRDWLAANPRIGMIYRSWDRMAEDARESIQARASQCLQKLDDL